MSHKTSDWKKFAAYWASVFKDAAKSAKEIIAFGILILSVVVWIASSFPWNNAVIGSPETLSMIHTLSSVVSKCLLLGFFLWYPYKKFEKLKAEFTELTGVKIVPRLISRGNHSYLLLVENTSKADISKFKLQFTLPTAKIFMGNDYANRLEIEKIFAGRDFQKHFCIGKDDPYEYEAEWSWTSIDGKQHTEKGLIIVEFKDTPSTPMRSFFSDSSDVQF